MNSHELPELLPCPFCGGQPIGPLEHRLLVETKHNIFCSDSRCHAELWASTARRAVLMWNRRAARKASPVQAETVGDWVMVPRPKLSEIFHALDKKLGDTDPEFPPDMTDEDIRDEAPVFWVAQQVAALLYTNPQPSAASVEAVEYDRDLIAEMLEDYQAKAMLSQSPKFLHASVAEMIRLLREADNRESLARTVRLGPQPPQASVEDVEAQAREAIRFAKDQLERHVGMLMPECDCEDCPQCGKPPSDCSGTACAATCQCSTCDHCSAKDAIAALEAALRTRSGGVDNG